MAVWSVALNPGANQYTGPVFSAKACFMVAGDITTSINKARWTGPMNGLLIYMSMGQLYIQCYFHLWSKWMFSAHIRLNVSSLEFYFGTLALSSSSSLRTSNAESWHSWKRNSQKFNEIHFSVWPRLEGGLTTIWSVEESLHNIEVKVPPRLTYHRRSEMIPCQSFSF